MVLIILSILLFVIQIKSEQESLHEIMRGDCVISIQISQASIPLRITTAGSYCVTENLKPASNTTVPIIIDVDNVVLDLNDKMIQGTAGNLVSGIVINTAKSNITIRNGTIANMTNNGIIVNAGAQNISLENIFTANNGIGINILGVSKCSLTGCTAVFSSSNGIQFGQAGNAIPQNIQLRDCASFQNGGNGFLFSNCVNVDIEECIANNNQQTGFNQQNNCNRINYTACNANSNALLGFLINGFNTFLNACLATGNGGAGFQLNGFRHSLTQCESTFNASGVQINNTNHCILECIAKGNTTFGFILNTNSTQCQVRNNTSMANVTGFQNNGTLNRVYANYASDNTTANFVGIPNVIVSPSAVAAINCTANIEN